MSSRTENTIASGTKARSALMLGPQCTNSDVRQESLSRMKNPILGGNGTSATVRRIQRTTERRSQRVFVGLVVIESERTQDVVLVVIKNLFRRTRDQSIESERGDFYPRLCRSSGIHAQRA